MVNALAYSFAFGQPALWLTLTLFSSNALASIPECQTQPLLGSFSSPSGLKFEGVPPSGLSSNEVQRELSEAIEAWNHVGCAPKLDFGSGAPVKFVEEDPCLPSGLLAFTVYACGDYPFGTILLNSRDFVWQVEPSPLAPRDAEGRLRVDLGSVLVHEIGHVLGLTHVEEPLATMAASYLTDGGQKSLAAVDKLELCERWDAPFEECGIDSDCQFRTCVLAESRSACEEERGEPGDYCSPDLQICAECFISDTQTLTGYCGGDCAECPSFMECIDGACRYPEIPQDNSCAGAFPFWLLFILRRRWIRESD